MKINITGFVEAGKKLDVFASNLKKGTHMAITADLLVGILKKTIESRGGYAGIRFTPNSPLTILVKGSDHPLKHTGKMLNSIKKSPIANGFFVGVIGERASSMEIQEYGALIYITPKIRGFFATRYKIFLNPSTNRVYVPPRPLFKSVMSSEKIRKELSNKLEQVFQSWI